MSQTSLLNKPLWNNITRLKLLNKPDGPVKFILEKSPFDEEEMDAAAPKDIIITGRILPDSKIYREGAYRIEMKLLPSYPCNPPEVRFLTPIYHPNVGQDGKFCCALLLTPRWLFTTSLVDIIIAVAKHIDHPDIGIEHSISLAIGQEYMGNKSEFDRKALEYVKKYALPRH